MVCRDLVTTMVMMGPDYLAGPIETKQIDFTLRRDTEADKVVIHGLIFVDASNRVYEFPKSLTVVRSFLGIGIITPNEIPRFLFA